MQNSFTTPLRNGLIAIGAHAEPYPLLNGLIDLRSEEWEGTAARLLLDIAARHINPTVKSWFNCGLLVGGDYASMISAAEEEHMDTLDALLSAMSVSDLLHELRTLGTGAPSSKLRANPAALGLVFADISKIHRGGEPTLQIPDFFRKFIESDPDAVRAAFNS